MRGSRRRGQHLRDIYQPLRTHFGYAPGWWPGSPMDVFVTALLVQQCDWSQAWKANARLKGANFNSLRHFARAHPEEIERLINPVAFAPTKSKRVVAIAEELIRRGYQTIEEFLDRDRDTHTVRRELLSLNGIGEETADSVLLFASQHPVFIVDAYTRRVFARLNIFPDLPEGFWRQAPYSRVQQFFEHNLMADLDGFGLLVFDRQVPPVVALFRDYHAQVVELAKHHCLRGKPKCHERGAAGWNNYFFCKDHCRCNSCTGCPVSDICNFASGTGR